MAVYFSDSNEGLGPTNANDSLDTSHRLNPTAHFNSETPLKQLQSVMLVPITQSYKEHMTVCIQLHICDILSARNSWYDIEKTTYCVCVIDDLMLVVSNDDVIVIRG